MKTAEGLVTLSLNGEEGKSMEVIPGSYVNNQKRGTARVTLRGASGYGGIKTVTYKIVPRSVSDWFDKEFRYWE